MAQLLVAVLQTGASSWPARNRGAVEDVDRQAVVETVATPVSRGIQRERQVRRLLEEQDFWTCRAAGSLGDADIVALKPGRRLLVEVKSSAQGPYEHFRPKDRADLLFAAEIADCTPVLCWWPPRGKPQWIEADAWPKGKAA